MIEAIIILHPTNTSGIIIIVLITKNNQEILLDLADLALPRTPRSYVSPISCASYNIGSYTMAIEPIKSLELHYTMIQFSRIYYTVW